MKLYQVQAPYMCAGFIADDAGWITQAAPILRWTVGKHLVDVQRWIAGKGFAIFWVSEFS